MEHTFRHLLQLSNEFAQEKEKLPPCPLYYINLFDKYHAVENDTSWALCEIFNYTEDGAYILFKLFAAKYLKPLGFDTDNIGQPFIKNEEYNIDLFISEQNYAIIFENKIKDAVFQRNQLGKYIARLIDSGYREEQIYLVVLPRHYTPSYIEEMRPSVWKSPKDWKTPNQCRACRHKDLYQCWCDDSSHALTPQEVAEHCQKCKDHKQAFYSRTVILDHTFADWLQDVLLAAVPADQYLVKSVIVQMADYLKGLFQTRLKDQPLMEMQEFLQKELLPSETNNLENWALLDKKLRQLPFRVRFIIFYITSPLLDDGNHLQSGLVCFISFPKGIKSIHLFYTSSCTGETLLASSVQHNVLLFPLNGY